MTPTQAVAELTYSSYAHNRRRSPWIAPERWARVYEGAEEMERRYQEETR